MFLLTIPLLVGGRFLHVFRDLSIPVHVFQDDIKDAILEQLIKLCPNLFEIVDGVDENAKTLLNFSNYFRNILEFLLICRLFDAQIHADEWDNRHDEGVEVCLTGAMPRYFHNDFEYARLCQMIEEIYLLQNNSDGATSQNRSWIFFRYHFKCQDTSLRNLNLTQ